MAFHTQVEKKISQPPKVELGTVIWYVAVIWMPAGPVALIWVVLLRVLLIGLLLIELLIALLLLIELLIEELLIELIEELLIEELLDGAIAEPLLLLPLKPAVEALEDEEEGGRIALLLLELEPDEVP